MKTHLCILITTLALVNGLSAQPNKKLAPALGKFLNTEFMVKFHDLKLEAESAATNLIAKEQKIKADDFSNVRTAYNQTAQRANKILEGIKQDFLDPKKLKSIESMPDMYSDGLKLRLLELQDFYSSHFQQTLADATADQVDGSPLLFIITELINLSRGLTAYFTQMQRESRIYSEDYLNQHMVKPHRWRYWNEVQAGEGNSDHYTDYIQYHDIQINPNSTAIPSPDLNNWNNNLNNGTNNSWNSTNNNSWNSTNNTNWNNTNNTNNAGYDPNATWNSTNNTTNGTTTDPFNTNVPPGQLSGVGDTTTMPPLDSLGNANDPFKYDGAVPKGKTPVVPGKQPVKNQSGAVPPKAKETVPVPKKNQN